VPYQLHCCALAQTDEATELDELLNTLLDERIDDDERTDEDGAIEDEGTLEDEILDGITLDRTEDATELWAPQTAPVTTGISTAPLVLTCTPKDTVFPGWTLPFQLKFDAL
jgi:hypothetical protein